MSNDKFFNNKNHKKQYKKKYTKYLDDDTQFDANKKRKDFKLKKRYLNEQNYELDNNESDYEES